MIVNNIKVEQAMKLCDLIGIVPVSTVYSRVLSARKKGTYDVLKLREEQEIRNLVIAIQDDSCDPLSEQDPTISPLTSTTRTDGSMVTTEASSFGSKSKKQSFRRSSKQKSMLRLLESENEKDEYDMLYKVAFKEATNLLAAAVAGTVPSKESAVRICNRLNAKYGLASGPGRKQLARSTIYEATKGGLAGQSPKKRGPPPKIPDAFLNGLASHAQVCQVGDGELRAKQMKRVIGASMLGTQYENEFQADTVWRKVCERHPQAFIAANKMTVEDARAQWTTHDNLDQWFTDVKADLLATEMVVDEIELDENGDLVSEVRFKPDVKRRIINMDETHHDLSITGDKGGSRSVTYHNPLLQRGANRGVKSARHVTGAYATTAAGEALPPFYIFDSSAKSEENFRVKVEWLAGLPTVSGRFGCPTFQEDLHSFYAVRPRGSMDESLLNQYIESVIVPLFPNMNKNAIFDPVTGRLNQGPVILKLDAGPGRIVSNAAMLNKREEFYERGLFILMGLPNATSVQQEMDQLYGPFKSATCARGEKVVQRKLKLRGIARRNGEHQQAAALSLDFSDLATIVNGGPDDPITDRPFDCHFSEAKILSSWAKIGFVPFTRKCLKNPKVRKELGQHMRDEELEQLQAKYAFDVDVMETIGFNPGILDAVVPTAVHVDRASTTEAQVEQLLKSGKAFSSSGHWNMCDSRIGNAGVTLIAQKRQIALNEEQRLKVVAKKTNASIIALQRAQQALAKYSTNNDSLNDKDWGDVVRWVLPEAKVDFLLKDLKKKEQIIAKLATLPRNWVTYIPNAANVAAILATGV